MWNYQKSENQKKKAFAIKWNSRAEKIIFLVMNPNCMKTLTMYQISLFYEKHLKNSLEKGESDHGLALLSIANGRFDRKIP